MLLTTAYCTEIDGEKRILKFRLHTAILLANKQISAESTTVLRDTNYFIIVRVKTIDMCLSEIPELRWLPDIKLTDPILRVVVDLAETRFQMPERTHTLLTTPDGIQSVISAMWDVAHYGTPFRIRLKIRHASLKVNLKLRHGTNFSVASY
jgi:hypothetical protein